MSEGGRFESRDPEGGPPTTDEAGSTRPAGSSKPGELAGLATPNTLTGSTPPVGWAPQAAPAARTGLGKLRVVGWLVVGFIVAGGAIGTLFFRDQLTADVADLRLRDCFDLPAGDGDVSDVQHRPCTDPHDAEVIFIGSYPNQDTYPADPAIETFVDQQCIPAFQAYIGRPFDNNSELDLTWFYPTPEGWNDGDREVTCSVNRLDGEKLTTSVKAA